MFEQIENEYLPILNEKDELLQNQRSKIEELQAEIDKLSAERKEEKLGLAVQMEMQKFEQEQDLRAERAKMETENKEYLQRELTKIKEIMQQEFDYKVSQQ